MTEGRIIKALSGFYDVDTTKGQTVRCRARGKFRIDGLTPLVGDRVTVEENTVLHVLPRQNAFFRPSVANVDQLVMLASSVNPVTDPYLIDRVSAIAVHEGCEVVLCLNQADLDPCDRLYEIYRTTPFRLIRTSAVTGEGVEELRCAVKGKTSAFTGNSGVGKSSLLNALDPSLRLKTGDVSEKLGRGCHTTRHVELFPLGDDTYIIDTPGFSSFDVEHEWSVRSGELPDAFPEFRTYTGTCRFDDCAHIKEPGCSVREAVKAGLIHRSRYESYKRLYAIADSIKEWELR